ncbi:MAG: hypothetical protein SFT93_00710 [Rickettsiaceae bacterium]|nr:hypothetical protein [Rickettsiaceae bacterium]
MSYVIKFQAPFEKLRFNKTTPESMLRRAIILQAIIDATNTSDQPNKVREAEEAKNWILGKSDYFVKLCDESGVEPDHVIRITKQAIKLQQNKKSCVVN